MFKLFSSSSSIDWRPLDSPNLLQEINEASQSNGLKGVAIFKHSTRCSVSFAAKRQLEKEWDFDDATLPIYFLDLLAFRAISNQIAEDYGVMHQSPQLLVIKNKQCVYAASHHSISVDDIKKVV